MRLLDGGSSHQKRPHHAIVAFPLDRFRAKGRFRSGFGKMRIGVGYGQAGLKKIVSPQRAVCSWDNAQ
jgi:hypothetical protein